MGKVPTSIAKQGHMQVFLQKGHSRNLCQVPVANPGVIRLLNDREASEQYDTISTK